MNRANIIDCVKVYQAEVDKLVHNCPHKYSLLELVSFFPRWYKYLNNEASPVQNELPWITFPAIRFLESSLTKDMVVYEYGSGGSTLFFAKRVKQVYSVEHNEDWFLIISTAIKEKGHSNWSGRLIEPVHDAECLGKSSSNSNAYVSGSPDFKGYSFKSYVESIDDFPNEYFDLILIDGRARPSCFRHAIPKVRTGGYIMWDNTERSYYLEEIPSLPGEWLRSDFPGPGPYVSFFTQTSIWMRQK
jgi:hypothetical protein